MKDVPEPEPVWLQLQNQQLLEAQVRPAPPFVCIVNASGVEHRFVGDEEDCVCGEAHRADGSVWVSPGLRMQADELPPPAVDTLTDEDVRRLEHPNEFQPKHKRRP